MSGTNAQAVADDIADKVKRLLAKPFGRLVIEKHDKNVYVEETDKHRSILK